MKTKIGPSLLLFAGLLLQTFSPESFASDQAQSPFKDHSTSDVPEVGKEDLFSKFFFTKRGESLRQRENSTTSENPPPSPCSLMPPFRPKITLEPASVLKRLNEGSGGKTLAVKNFKRSWVEKLFQRGKPVWYGSEGFDYIGMPVGGIGAGQVYLGGDGKLWHWDIFNTGRPTKGVQAYRSPPKQSSPIMQGFAIRLGQGKKSTIRSLDRRGFKKIRFSGQYPVGYVKYNDPDLPVEVTLEAFSPFCPLQIDDSSLPATICTYKVRNKGKKEVKVGLAGWIENAALESLRGRLSARRLNRIEEGSVGGKKYVLLSCEVELVKEKTQALLRPDILFEDFESGTYSKWRIEGEAFGFPGEPLRRFFHHQPLKGFKGKHLADSFRNNGRSDASAPVSDSYKGRLISRPFKIQRKYITFLIGGGRHKTTCMQLKVGGKVVRQSSGDNSETLKLKAWDVSELEGQEGVLEIVDDHSGSWGHVLVDHIVFTDRAPEGPDPKKAPDFGNMCLSVWGDLDSFFGSATIPHDFPSAAFERSSSACARTSLNQKLVGAVGACALLKPGAEKTFTFVITWFFPNTNLRGLKTDTRRWYANKYKNAEEVLKDILKRFHLLSSRTRLWKETWYDSTLPYWFLDRTFLNTSILATQTCYRFADGRFYGYEGVYCCPGTCTHVWGYVQALGRLFPSLERTLRCMVDYNPKISFEPQTGAIRFRGEFHRTPRVAVDGQSGVILRTLLAHQMSPDNSFLRKVWPQAKKAIQYLMDRYDPDRDGVLEGAQHNTLDAAWYGKITWLSLYYCAALRAMEQMALDMGEPQYAAYVRGIAEKGAQNIAKELFNGEYFFHKPDPKHPKSPGVFSGCEYSQLLGQSWAYQVGLGEIIDNEKVEAALRSLWRYNFTTDVGPFRAKYKRGRWFAMPGEGGLIACTFPRGGDEVLGHGNPFFAGYLNECQVGYAYAATSLMMWEGMVDYAFAHVRIVHERYHPSKRNPWNEIECGEHYARSMASYGLFTAVCGYEYYGPRLYIAFSPRLTPENFRAAFTAAEGWGTFDQRRINGRQIERLTLKWGRLKVKRLAFDVAEDKKVSSVEVRLRKGEGPDQSGAIIPIEDFSQFQNRVCITLQNPLVVKKPYTLEVTLLW